MSELKHAILILAHNNIEIIKKLILSYDSIKFDFYIHIDGKEELNSWSELTNITKYSSVVLLEEREKVYWGDISIVNAEFLLLEKAKNKRYEYYHLLSGMDFPLVSPNEFYYTFHNRRNEFIDIWNNEKEEIYCAFRYKYYYHFKYWNRTQLLKVIIHSILFIQRTIQKLLNVNRLDGLDYKIGSQWFSITDELVEYILDNKDNVLKRFKYSIIPDESFIQTLVFNSKKFRNKLYVNEQGKYSNLREIDFSNGTPSLLNLENYTQLKDSNNVIARKFAEGISEELIEKFIQDWELENADKKNKKS